jgi:hypothetical protein
MADEVSKARARLGGLFAFGRTPEPEVEAAARRELTLAKLERSTRDALAAVPPLTLEQRERVARLLVGGGEVA